MSESPPRQQDSELQAMLAILEYLEPLDRDARKRVLTWADDRLVALKFAEEIDQEAPRKFIASLGEAAKKMGGVTPLDIIRAADAIAQLREDAIAAGVIEPDEPALPAGSRADQPEDSR